MITAFFDCKQFKTLNFTMGGLSHCYFANFASFCTLAFKKIIFREWNFIADSEKASNCSSAIEKDEQPNAGLKNPDEVS